MNRLNHLIGNKKFYKEVMLIAFPVMLQQLISGSVNLIDNIMVGNLGELAMSSVTISNKYFWIFSITTFGVCGGASIFISQYFGANDKYKCRDLFRINLLLNIIVMFLFVGVLFIAPQLTLSMYTKDQAIIQTGIDYLQYAKYSFIPFAISATCMMSLRAIGQNKIPLYAGIVSVITNTVLNYCFIYGKYGFPEMGVQGAAIATVIARVFEMLIYIYVLQSHKTIYRLELKRIFMIDTALLKNVMYKALPFMANEIIWSASMLLIFRAYSMTSTQIIPSLSVVDTAINLVFILFGGISSSIAIMVGKQLGANRLEEAVDNSKKLTAFGVTVAMGASIILALIAPLIPNLYNYSDQVNHYIVMLLRIKCLFFPLYMISVSVFFTLRAGGDMKSTLLMDAGFAFLGPALVSTIVASMYSPDIILFFIAIECFEFIKIALAIYLWKKKSWVKNLTLEKETVVMED